MESWRRVWREGFAPAMSDAALTALRAGLANDDERIVQGSTTVSHPLAWGTAFTANTNPGSGLGLC